MTLSERSERNVSVGATTFVELQLAYVHEHHELVAKVMPNPKWPQPSL